MIVLDTHSLIWYIDCNNMLSAPALAKIEEQKKNGVYVSSISAWEIYMLVKKGRLKLNIDPQIWLDKCERLSFLNFIPVDNTIARISVNLKDYEHADPADRIIIATAMFLGAPLVTKDEKIKHFKGITTVW